MLLGQLIRIIDQSPFIQIVVAVAESHSRAAHRTSSQKDHYHLAMYAIGVARKVKCVASYAIFVLLIGYFRSLDPRLSHKQ